MPDRKMRPATRGMPDGHVRVSTILPLGELIASLGGDASAVFRAARIDERRLCNADAPVPISVRDRLLALAAEATGCEHFGLLLGLQSGLPQLGVAGQLALAASTVGDALATLQRNWHLHSAASIVLLRRVGAEVEFGVASLDGNLAGAAVFEDGAMAIARNVVRNLLNDEAWSPSAVHLMRRVPRTPEVYRSFFGAPCLFNAPVSALRFPAETLHLPRSRIPEAGVAGQPLRSPPVEGSAWLEHVRRQVHKLLLQGMCSQSALAADLGMSARTMNRRLAAAGTTYAALSDSARFAVSRRLMRETDLPLGELALVLGYVEASSFSRAFRRWSGLAPEAWRREKAGQTRQP